MIRHNVRFSEVRFYREDTNEAMPDFDAVCNLLHITPTVVRVSMMHGTLTRKMLREFVTFLHEQGIVTVRADRAPGRFLPLFRKVGDHLEMSVAEAMAYGNRPP